MFLYVLLLLESPHYIVHKNPVSLKILKIGYKQLFLYSVQSLLLTVTVSGHSKSVTVCDVSL